ncbi:MAG: hypothetical protein Q8P93_01010 [bacterium]|nr:hypothetical protein [bacterium]
MSTSQIASYIEQRKAAGASDQMIQDELRKSGWSEPDISVAFGVAPQPPMPGAPVPPVFGNPMSSMGSATNPHMVEIVRIFAIWGAVAGGINGIAGYISSSMFFGSLAYLSVYGGSFGISSILTGVISGAIGGGISGFLVSMWWNPIITFFKQMTGGWLDTPFKLFFILPAISAVLLGLSFLQHSPMFVLVKTGGALLGSYLFAINAGNAITRYIGQ